MLSSASASLALIRSLCLCATLVAWLGVAAAWCSPWAWWLDLLAHFRLQYALVFVACLFIALVLQAWGLAAVAALGAVYSIVTVHAYIGLAQQQIQQAVPTVRLMTFNVWFRSNDDARIARFITQSAADVVVLQELSLARARAMQSLLPSLPHAYLEAVKPHGAVIFSRWPIVAAETLALGPDHIAAARVTINREGQRFEVIGVHLHWPMGPHLAAARNSELETLAALAAAQSEPLLIAGDFNITPWSAHFNAALDASRLRDCARGRGLNASWPSQFPLVGIRIDQCLASRQWRVLSLHSGPALGSDHLPTLVDLELLNSVSPLVRPVE